MARILVDDVGSFPLLEGKLASFDGFYFEAYRYLTTRDVDELVANRGFKSLFYDPVIHSFIKKANSGLDIINYPQHFSMHEQFLRPIMQHPVDDGPFLIDPAHALIPEVRVIEHYMNSGTTPGLDETVAQRGQLQLKACVTGPIESYIKTDLGFTVYKDLLFNIARSINHFVKASLVDTPGVRTSVISVDEPSLGFIDLFNVDEQDLVKALDIACEGVPDHVTVQIHLHSLRDAALPLKTKNIDVLTCEYASDPTNVISKDLLVKYGKKMRVGICRTNYNAIIGELYEKGIEVGRGHEEQLQLIDPEVKILQNLQRAIEHYGKSNVSHVGPDCGLSAWQPPELASTLLSRVVSVAKSSKIL